MYKISIYSRLPQKLWRSPERFGNLCFRTIIFEYCVCHLSFGVEIISNGAHYLKVKTLHGYMYTFYNLICTEVTYKSIISNIFLH